MSKGAKGGVFLFSAEDSLPQELRELVRDTGRLLGEVIEREVGAAFYKKVEALRTGMAGLRDQDPAFVSRELASHLENLRELSHAQRRSMAHAFTLFLELMNACENAYRSHRLHKKHSLFLKEREARSLVYVLTAHPTEARSPQNIEIFQRIQHTLADELEIGANVERYREKILHELELAWRAFPTRERAPRVKDEAGHIFHLALRPEILTSILQASQEVVPLYFRTWVGGDKDGHPGVNEKAMMESLGLSRADLLRFLEGLLHEVESTIHLLPGKRLRSELRKTKSALSPLRRLSAADGKKVAKAKKAFAELCTAYKDEIHVLHPSLRMGKRLFHVFPALVVPLEFRESSDMLMRSKYVAQKKAGKKAESLAMERMIEKLKVLAKGGNPLWYVRGFIVSMTSELEHLAAAEAIQRAIFGAPVLPVIPLFETEESLYKGTEIVRGMIEHKFLGKALRSHWKNSLEIMVGYSDSSKQAGALASRLAIATAMHALEAEIKAAGIKPIFFQGSGGSVDRGGGTVGDQVAWWPRSALETYKVTIQGEMVERSLSSPSIARGQMERIEASVAKALEKTSKAPQSKALFRMGEMSSHCYRELIHDADFLSIAGAATPYKHLTALKIGSRPTSRTAEISVEGLRAIPWVLCWTQTRVLFQTWWGLGTAWKKLSDAEKKALAAAYKDEPMFTSFIKALGFTLAKVELPVWKIYLEQSGLDPALTQRFYQRFEEELAAAGEMVRALSGSQDPLWFKPWLGASIRLRSPIIHPLNLLQILAVESRDFLLFRTTVTGVSSGMMTTG